MKYRSIFRSRSTIKRLSKMNNFELQYQVSCNGKIPVSKYISKETGLTVCIAQVDGPIVNGYLCLGDYI